MTAPSGLTPRFPASVRGVWYWPILVYVLVPLALWPFEHAGLRMGGLLLVGWAVPGMVLGRAWRLPDRRWPVLVLAAWGLGLCWLIGGALLAHYLPGPLAAWQLWAVYTVAGSSAVLLAARQPAEKEPPAAAPRGAWWVGGALLAAALLLRLPGLGYHEFHADEVVLLRQAAAAIQGEWTALAEHTKGPGEIAVVLAVYRGLGTIDEWTARLPFALMSVGSILATAWLGLRLARGSVGVWAALLLLGNGFALGLSRIAQYQPGILLLAVLAVWALWEFMQRGDARWLSLAAVFSAFGLILHYEIGLLAPVLLWMAVMGLRRRADGIPWRTLLWSSLGGAALLAVAYVPPLLSPYFATTRSYLGNRLGDTPVFNLPFFVEMGTFYNSTVFFAGLVLLAAVGTWQAAQMQRRVALALTLWWLPYFVLYIFVVRFPGTHFYQMMPAWSLLAALPLAWLTDQLRTPRGTRALTIGATALLAGWLAVSGFYLYLLFFRQNPEYLVNIDRERLALYWAPYPVPQKPRFGFPIHAGWKTVGVLAEWGYLDGTYSSNDRSWALRTWYRAPLPWVAAVDAQPDYVLAARHIQEENLEYHEGYHATYHRIGEVRFRAEPRIELWAKAPLPVPYVVFDAEQFAPIFDHQRARLDAPDDPVHFVEDGLLGGEIRLHSVNQRSADAAAGATLHLTLNWQVATAPSADYKLFVHVVDAGGQPLAQWDGYPGLNTQRTSTWAVGRDFTDHVLLTLPETMEAGRYTLLAGLYDPMTGARLGERALPIGALTVR